MKNVAVSRSRMRIALAGNPNCGKTSLFNELTGANQEVGNFPGVTVEFTSGTMIYQGQKFDLIDLPGTYSLTAYSLDEIVARDYLLKQKPDVILNVVDASNLERQLYLTVQLMELGLPMIIALNMMDVAERHGVQIDTSRLSALLGMPVIATQASESIGIQELKSLCAGFSVNPSSPRELSYSHELEGLAEPIEEAIGQSEGIPADFPKRWLALKLLEHDHEVESIADTNPAIRDAVIHAEKQLLNHSGEDATLAISEARLGMASGIVMDCVKMTKPDRHSFTDRIDAVVCDRILGPPLLAVVIYLLFSAIFGIAEDLHWIPLGGGEWVSPCGLFGAFFDWLGSMAEQNITNPLVLSLVRDAVVAGVGGVLEYVPLIFMMFLFIALLEDTGYIARVAFILDRVLRSFGLQGKSILAMIISGGLGGGGCAVPGILATRTLREEKDRFVTMLVVPMMNCGAKFPLYAVLIAAFFPNFQGGMMFLLWVLSWVFSMSAAWVLRRFVIRGEQTPFIMELPVYHVPTVKGVLQHTWMRTWEYVKKAGTIILMVSVILWGMMFFPQQNTSQFRERREQAKEKFHEETKLSFGEAARELSENRTLPSDVKTCFDQTAAELKKIASEEGESRLTHSFAGRIGTFLTPVTELAGFDWRINVALLGGFAAKEVVVGTLATAYSMNEETSGGDDGSLSRRLTEDPDWGPLRAFALMIFVMLYAPCAAAVVAIRKESNSWKWATFSIVYSTTFAFLAAVIIYQVGRLFVG